MKKLMKIFVLVAAAAMALASCQKPEIENVQPQEFEYKFLIGNADTKATVGEACVEWELGDKVGTYNSKSNNKYSSVTALTPATLSVYAPSNGTTSAGLEENEVMYFYYPYASGDEVQKTSVAMSIPAVQDGDDDMPMVSLPVTVTSATTDVQNEYAGEIKFANLGSVIEFNVYTETEAYAAEVVESVTFEADKALAGAFTFDLTKVNYSDESTLSISDLTETTVVANASDLAVGTKDAPAVVKMVVAPGTYAGNIIVKTDAATYTFPISTEKEFKRSAIKPLGLKLREDVREETKTVTFDFTSADELNALGVTLPDPSAGTSVTTLTKGDVIFVADGGSTKTRVYNSSGKYDLRAYKGATLTFSAPSGYVISDVILTGSATTSISTSVMPSNPVVLTVAANADTQKISTITVKYVEGEVVAVPLTMGAVTCVNQTTNSLTFSWDEVSGAEGYKVSLDGGNNWSDQFDATSYTWESLDSASEYTIYVKAVGNGINTLDSEAVSVNGTTEVEQAGVVTNSVEFTFTGSNGQNDFTLAQPPIKIAFAKAEGSNAPYDHSDKHVRFYNGNTMTFTGGTIVKIELKYSNTSYPGTGTTANVGTLSQDTNAKMWTWIGKNTTVTLTGGSKQGRYDSITVYYESDGTLPDPVQLTMSNVTCSEQTANSLTFKWDAVEGAVGYEVSFNGGDVETVNEPTYTANELTAETTYSISVKAVGDGTYYLTSDAVSADGTTLAEQSGDEPAWTLVTDASTLTAGDQVVIVAKESNYALSTTQNSNNRGQASVVKSGNNITFGSDVQVLTLQAGKTSGTFAFYTGVGYLYAASSSSNYLRTETILSANSSWNISITSAGVATVKATGTNTRNWMRYNSSSKIFACYSSGQADILIYRYQ